MTPESRYYHDRELNMIRDALLIFDLYDEDTFTNTQEAIAVCVCDMYDHRRVKMHVAELSLLDASEKLVVD